MKAPPSYEKETINIQDPSTMCDIHKDFYYVPARERHEKTCSMLISMTTGMGSILRRKGIHGAEDLHLNENPQGYNTDVILVICHNRQVDKDRTIRNAQSICKYYSIEEHRAKQIVHLILCRIQRMSRLFSGCLRHDPREESQTAMKKRTELNLDGSCELFEALTSITHAKNFLRNKPGIFLMTMFPNYGKSSFEVAFVFPSFDGTYEERQKKKTIVPRGRWIDCLTSTVAHRAIRPAKIRTWSCT